MTKTAVREDLLLDEVLPEFDETIVEHLIVEATPDVVYEAVRNMDMMDIHSPLMDAAMFVRGLPIRIGRWLRREPAPPAPPSMRLADLHRADDDSTFMEGWVPLGEDPGREIVFGAAGKVWQPDIEWRTVPPEEFSTFGEPGFAKVAAGFSVRSYGATRTVLSYEARTANTDETSRRRFRRYWWFVRFFVGVIMRAALRTAKSVAEREATAQKVPGGDN